jgi:serine/threonine protein kinase
MNGVSDLSFAKVAVSRGFVTPEQLREAFGIQKRVEDAGIREDLGAILLKKGWLRPEQLAEIHAGLDQGVKEFLQGYEILATVGRGGMGTVYRARRLSDGAIVAIKTLLPSFAREQDAVDRFLRESQVLQKLHHPHIVAAFDAGYQNGIYYLVMEFVEGDTLAQVVKARGKLPWKEAIKIVKAVAFALEHAARYGIVHRDIKPDNLILTPSGGVKITDLGLAKMVTGERDTTLTQSGFVLGTPAFMSPEQVQGLREIDIRSDIYSLGITLFAALTGLPPFRDENPLVVLQMRLKEDVPFGKLKELGVPDEVISIGRKMTMRDPRNRYQTPAELLENLMSLEAGETRRRTTVSPESAQGGLFGRIAVLNRFITGEQLDRCIALQEELLARGVKRPIGEIMLDEGLINRRQLRKILSLQSFYDRRNEERKMADLAIKNGFATQAQVNEALARQKDIFLLEGHAPTLDQILRSKGIINEQQRKALLRARRRLEEKDGVRDTLIGVRECPRCLEVIPLYSTQCPRCENVMEQGQVQVKCRACGRTQTEPGEFCLFCGANPVTGHRPHTSKLKTCPKCGKYAAFYQLRCAACKSALPGSFVRNLIRGTRAAPAYVWRHSRAAVALALILVAGYLIVMRATSAGRFWAELFGGEPAAVRHQVEDLLDALLHRDYMGAARFTGREEAAAEQAQANALRLYERVFGAAEGTAVRRYQIEKVFVDEDRATAYIVVEFGFEGALGAQPDQRRVSLYLVRESGRWRVR